VKMTIGINDLVDAVNGLIDVHELSNEERLVVLNTIVEKIMAVPHGPLNERTRAIVKDILAVERIQDEFYYYSTVVGDIVVRYYDYISDSEGYSAMMEFVVSKKIIQLQGTPSCRIRRARESLSVSETTSMR